VFIGQRAHKSYVLIPYHPGNAVHGHAAKLWSNTHGTIVIFDDHSALSSVTISGPSWVISHKRVRREFPLIAGKAASVRRHNKTPVLILNGSLWLPILSILEGQHAASTPAGEARHDKKPAYLAANTLPTYDNLLQHEREKAGRPLDPSGGEHRPMERKHAKRISFPPGAPPARPDDHPR
jgi:hypothetical protein